ncbi:hypothetical protein ACQ4PT_053530 [Festuca glaucescens]
MFKGSSTPWPSPEWSTRQGAQIGVPQREPGERRSGGGRGLQGGGACELQGARQRKGCGCGGALPRVLVEQGIGTGIPVKNSGAGPSPELARASTFQEWPSGASPFCCSPHSTASPLSPIPLQALPPPVHGPVCTMEGNIPSAEGKEEYCMMVTHIFGSQEDAYEYYNSYASWKGFSVRKADVKYMGGTNIVVRRRFCCSKEGYRLRKYFETSDQKREPRALTQCGCEAELEIERNADTGLTDG